MPGPGSPFPTGTRSSTPYFAKTGADGTAEVSGLPPGRYRLEVWHPRLAAAVGRELAIRQDDQTTQVISVVLRQDRRIRRAPDTSGGQYK